MKGMIIMSRKNYVKYSKMNKEENNEVVLDKTSFEEEVMTQNSNQDRIDEILEHLTYDMTEEERQAYHAELEELGYEDKTNEIDVTEDTIQEALKEETRTGVVSGCAKLRVRKEADIEADIYGTIEEGTELTVSITYSTEKFYKVNTIINDTLVSGYCMKKFIELK